MQRQWQISGDRMSIEEEIQSYYIKMLQKYSIDFTRIKNTAFKGKARSSYSYGVFKDGKPCDKYFPDVLFCFAGEIFMREFGEPNRHKERKQMQADRMQHWADNGSVNCRTILNMEDAKMDWEEILKDKSMEIV